jgi:hypothetical protein
MGEHVAFEVGAPLRARLVGECERLLASVEQDV